MNERKRERERLEGRDGREPGSETETVDSGTSREEKGKRKIEERGKRKRKKEGEKEREIERENTKKANKGERDRGQTWQIDREVCKYETQILLLIPTVEIFFFHFCGYISLERGRFPTISSCA